MSVYCKNNAICKGNVTRFDDNMLCFQCEKKLKNGEIEIQAVNGMKFTLKDMEEKYKDHIDELASKVNEIEKQVSVHSELISNSNNDRFETLREHVENETIQHLKIENGILSEQLNLIRKVNSENLVRDLEALNKLELIESKTDELPKETIIGLTEGLSEANRQEQTSKFKRTIEKIKIPTKEEIEIIKKEEKKQEEKEMDNNRLTRLSRPTANSISKQAKTGKKN